MRRWFLWAPVVMVASLLYWTLALGLGGLSLMAASSTLCPPPDSVFVDAEPSSARYDQSFDPIVLHLEESAEPEDVNDNVGCGYSELQAEIDRARGAEPAGSEDAGPGITAF